MRKLMFGIPILVATLAACSGGADNSAGPGSSVADLEPTSTLDAASSFDADPDSTAVQEAPGTAAPSIQIGKLALTWEAQEIGEGIKPSFAIDQDGVAHIAFLTEADHGGLFYAQNREGGFEVETVAEGGDSGIVRHAWKEASGWQIEDAAC